MDRGADGADRVEKSRPADAGTRLRLHFLKDGNPFLQRWILAQVLGPPVAFRLARGRGARGPEPGSAAPDKR